MPVTNFQREVLGVLAGLRSPTSHFAGSLPLHISVESSRFSHDFNIFHDAERELALASVADVAALERNGYTVEKGDWTSSFRRIRIWRDQEKLDVDYAFDSAMRFFPAQPDTELGWKLHAFDLATNKSLALAARAETRDLVDIVEWSRRFSLAAIVWAACGKDPGYNPIMLLGWMRRFAKIRPEQLREIAARHIDPVELKSEWLEMAVVADETLTALADAQPDVPIGVIFTRDDGLPVWPDDPTKPLAEQGLQIHHPTLGGCWPRVSGLEGI